MKTLILRTMRHTNIWESERKSCTFEKNQLKDMILVWQKDFLQLKTSDINLALGIYGGMYFDNPFWGGAAFRGSINEQIISIIKPTALDNSDSFQIVRGLDDDNPHTILHYDVIGKLWSGPDRNQMFSIEDDLIEAKISELKNKGNSTDTAHQYPLSFLLDTNTVFSILSKYNYDL
ncbi:MAG: hypothetical protein HN729_08340 [Candidatus Marinimicrobia bacterium]|nr:hypothetical protein [Candidatus Neomarinimicrobiota bacterium]MBT3634971.1 hypothetical protein [Candidatus Neomarinimicrobiota bacterium]MBT3683676.1 hypothetical protein [Candidatus Neomarinimicrobiota bacterium]MBT3760816.1 hypothetical protein [Candidatus Neomarinimicrobiota bacterium]MBT3896886.1 hypothetical protein [Candidatus Neomarinimicrobiota bacterium]